MARIPNMLKLEFFSFRMVEGEVTAWHQTVRLTGKLTDAGSPEIVGIPILHHVPHAKRLNKLLNKTRRVVEALQADDSSPAPLLRLRSLHSFAVASVDFVLSGVLLRPVHLAALHARVHSAYRRALGAPKWTPADFTHGTREAGGFDAPLLSLRNTVRLALSYAQAAASRNPLVRYVALALARLQHRVCEAIALQQRLQPLGITLHALPDASVDSDAVHVPGNLNRAPPTCPCTSVRMDPVVTPRSALGSSSGIQRPESSNAAPVPLRRVEPRPKMRSGWLLCSPCGRLRAAQAPWCEWATQRAPLSLAGLGAPG